MQALINRCSVAVHQKTTSEKQPEQPPAKIITFLVTKSLKHQVHHNAGAVFGLVTSVAVKMDCPLLTGNNRSNKQWYFLLMSQRRDMKITISSHRTFETL